MKNCLPLAGVLLALGVCVGACASKGVFTPVDVTAIQGNTWIGEQQGYAIALTIAPPFFVYSLGRARSTKRWQRRLAYRQLANHLLVLDTDTVELSLQSGRRLRVKPLSFETSNHEVVDLQYDLEFTRQD